MIVYAKIRRMYFREKLSISETGWPRAISRKTSLSRNTVKKWLREPEGTEAQYRRSQTDTILKSFEPWLLQALKADSYRPKRDRRTALMLFTAIRTQGFADSYSRVTRFAHQWRERGGTVSSLGFRATQIQTR